MKSQSAQLFEGLELLHPEIENRQWAFSFFSDSYAGNGGYSFSRPNEDKSIFGMGARQTSSNIHVPSTVYLDRFPLERDDSFLNRLRSSTYVNFVQPIVDLYSDLLFRRKASRQISHPMLREWTNNMDSLSKKAMKIAQIYGTAFVLFDTQQIEANNLLEAIQQGYSGLYPTILNPSKILSWSADDAGNLNWIKYKIVDIRTDSPIEPSYTHVKYVVWTKENWQIFEKDVKKNEANLVANGVNPFGRVPVVVLRYADSDNGDFLGQSQISALSDLNRAYYNRLSELTTLLRGQAFSQLVLPQSPGNPDNEIMVGPNSIILVDPESKVEPKYISPSAENSTLYEKRLVELQNDIFRVAKLEYLRQQMTGRMQGNVSSGLSRQFSFAQCNSALVSMGKQLEKFEKDCLDVIACYHGIDCEYTVQYPYDYELNAGANDLAVLKEAISLNMPEIVIQKLVKSISSNLVNLDGNELDNIDKQIKKPEEKNIEKNLSEEEENLAIK